MGFLRLGPTLLLAPATLIFMLWDPQSRRWWRQFEPYIAALLALAVFSPVIIWNAQHDWASFAFQTSRRLAEAPQFALHKLIVSQLRIGRPEKSLKDLAQAAALIAALGENHPGAIESAFAKTAISTRKHIRKSLMQIRAKLEPHPRAWEEAAAVAKL